MTLNQRGFTLIELVVVIAILSTLACFAIPQLTQAQENASILKARMDLISIDSAIAAYNMSKGSTPSGVSLAKLTALGFLPGEPKPPQKLAGLRSGERYCIDGNLGRAYVLLTGAGKTTLFYSDTDLTR